MDRNLVVALLVGSIGLVGWAFHKERLPSATRPSPGWRPPMPVGKASPELNRLIEEEKALAREVAHYEEEVIRWRAEVSSRPESLVAPIGLSGAEQGLSHSRAELEIVQGKIARLQR